MNLAGKRYWLVGAADGLGAALAHKMSRAGAEVILSSRSEDKLCELAKTLPGKSKVLPVDIANDASVSAAGAALGSIDGVVLLAGVYWPFGAQDWNPEQATAMADINFTGYVRVLGQVVPDFAARDAGHIVITSSLTAFRGLPGSIGYTASKAASLSLAECLYADLRHTGVRVQVALPGFIKTRLTEKNDFNMPFIMTADDAAQVMFEFMMTERFKLSYPARFAALFRLAQFLPDALYYRLFAGK